MQSISQHFKRESWVMLGFVAGPLLLGILAAMAVPNWLHEADVKRCLRSGGKYDDDKQVCVTASVTKPAGAR
jgi:hypothetical protein